MCRDVLSEEGQVWGVCMRELFEYLFRGQMGSYIMYRVRV